MVKELISFILFFVFSTVDVFAVGHKHPNEAAYVDKFCTGIVEQRTDDRLRVDCTQNNQAMEFDWGHKWAECIGQALEYGRALGLESTCVLILRKDSDMRYVKRVIRIIQHYHLPLSLYTVMWGTDLSQVYPSIE